MEDVRLLWDAFNLYYRDGMNALDEGNLEVAKRNLYSASNSLLKLAKKSEGSLKEQRLARAEEIMLLAERIEKKQYRTVEESTNNASKDAEKFANEAKTHSSSNSSKAKSNGEDDDVEFLPSGDTGVKLDDVAGLEEVKQEIQRRIIEPLKYPEVYEMLGKKKGGGILLYGVPGTGKTMIAKAIANEIDAKFFPIKCSDIASKWFGDSERKVRKLFETARSYPCSIIFFDEFESLGSKRDTPSTVMKRLVPELLAQMQGFDKSESTLVLIAATNRPWDIDSAFLRPGRFNTKVYVPLPDEVARRYIIDKQLSCVPGYNNLDIDHIVETTNKFNGADVVEFCDQLKQPAIDRNIQEHLPVEVRNEDIAYAESKVKSSVRYEDIQKIQDFEQNNAK